MEKQVRVTLTGGNKYRCIVVKKEHFINFDGQELPIGEDMMRAFTPSQVEDMKEYAPELYPIYRAMCTPDVIKRWEEYLKQIEETV